MHCASNYMDGDEKCGAVVKKTLAMGQPHDASSTRLGERITLLVDGKRFVVDPSLFREHPNTMLAR